MAIDLKDEKEYTIATVEYEDYKSDQTASNCVIREGHAEKWKTWAKRGDAIDNAWNQMKKILQRDPCPFEVEATSVPDDTGSVQIKWSLIAEKTNPNLEPKSDFAMYAVMRAEDEYCSGGYEKLASQYCIRFGLKGKGNVPIVDKSGKPIMQERFGLGIDNFFKGNSDYIICESKFVGTKSEFETMRDKNDGSVSTTTPIVGKPAWSLLKLYRRRKGNYRQMDWTWVELVAGRAGQFPDYEYHEDVKEDDIQRFALQVDDMREAIEGARDGSGRSKVRRILNIWGANDLPVYPGRYSFRLGEKFKLSNNELEVTWTFNQDSKEFFDLDNSQFDVWCVQQAAKPKRKRKKK